jgi:hypothetical protein
MFLGVVCLRYDRSRTLGSCEGLRPEDLGDLLELLLLAVLATSDAAARFFSSGLARWRDNGFNVMTRSIDGRPAPSSRRPGGHRRL